MKYVSKTKHVHAWRHNGNRDRDPMPDWMNVARDQGLIRMVGDVANSIGVTTRDGSATCELGDWIVMDGVELFVMKDAEFEARYMPSYASEEGKLRTMLEVTRNTNKVLSEANAELNRKIHEQQKLVEIRQPTIEKFQELRDYKSVIVRARLNVEGAASALDAGTMATAGKLLWWASDGLDTLEWDLEQWITEATDGEEEGDEEEARDQDQGEPEAGG